MKKINFILSIFILSQLGFSLPLKAQSRCQATINSIVNEIESKGVRRVILTKRTVTNRRNPTNRKDENVRAHDFINRYKKINNWILQKMKINKYSIF